MINEDLNTASFIIDLKLFITLKLKLPNNKIVRDKNINVNRENFC